MIVQLKHLRPNRRVTILPVINVWGRKMVEAGKICQRKNKRGVDTNRNYPQKVHHVYHKTSEEYQGKYPISEKETKLVSAVLRGAKKYINVHSGEFSLYMPWDSITERPPNLVTSIYTTNLQSKQTELRLSPSKPRAEICYHTRTPRTYHTYPTKVRSSAV